MNIKEIKEMINLMNDNNLMELEVEKDGMRIRLKKSSGYPEGVASPITIEQEKMAEAGKPREIISEPAVKASAPNTIEVKAPMVGTFYRAPAPEAPPYVEVGQVIEPGQVICIIEAMKLMNEIKSEIKGKIIEILVDNAEPVEYGQSMFHITPV